VLGMYAPEHYIFHRQWPKADPTLPMSGWRSAWRSLRLAAEMPTVRYYDLRHQFVTELMQEGVPESIIAGLAGHFDSRMSRDYSRPRMAARRAAVESSKQAKSSRVTSQTTSQKLFPRFQRRAKW
jgi:integrase